MSLCAFGNHHVGGEDGGFRRTLGRAVLLGPRNLNGREWVAGRAHNDVKERILAIRRRDYYATSVARATVEAELDNFVLRLQHLNRVRV